MQKKNVWSRVYGTAVLGGALLAGGSIYGCSSSSPVSFGSGSADELRVAEDVGLSYLGELVSAEGFDVDRDFVVERVFIDELDMAHTRVQQLVGGVPVFGGEAIVHMNQDGSLFAFTDTLVKGIPANFDVTPALSAQEVVDQVVLNYDCAECLTAPPSADLWVLQREEVPSARVVYRVQLQREDGSDQTEMPVLFIDASTGEEVWRYDNLQTATGSSLYSGTVTITTSSVSGTYYLEDLSRKVGTFDMRNRTASVYRFTDTNDVWDSATQKAGVDAHYGAEKVMDYYLSAHGRNGIDGSGGPGLYAAAANASIGLISSKVHYGKNYVNAYWNGNSMTYGDGNGTQSGPLVTLDICGHEMTHGVTERTANLTYSGQSGALNESMSDVLGSMVERYARGESANTWKIGEDCWTPGTGGDALRYMDNPHLASNSGYTADDDPDHYSERYTGTSDNGGVHINSGIVNKAFYLVAKGGSHHLGGSMTGIGADAAASIWYKALTTYMTSSTNFSGARAATLSAAAALYGSGSAQHNAVGQAWTLCGVN